MLTLTPGRSARAADHDDQAWVNLSLITPLAPRSELKVDGFTQLTGTSSPARELVRIVARTRLGDQMMLGGGYVWTHVDSGGSDFTEHRAVEQLDFQQPLKWRGGAVTSRTQLEERYRGGQRGMSLRLRQLTRLDAPIGKAGVGVVLWNEYFHELRDTRWAGGAGPGLMLNFVGVHVPFARGVAIEPGYLRQTTFQPGPNPEINAAAIWITVRR
ncbi:DUF2490 domain-containing protein [Caulobacter sp. 602-1]|uniref:DUF2490 domain-containing protein n=1 Tax=Caulobacter sp. 602-1 TaxID=2492472 RepID=UPI0013150625|nr:DUF2490 domain-containing protein [Caulobacter sp. 602-1]